MDTIDQQLGQALLQRRTSLGVDENSLARVLGIPVEQLQLREEGRARFSASELHKVCEVLDLNPSFRSQG